MKALIAQSMMLATVLMVTTPAAEAVDQSGGLPEVAARVTVLETQVNTLQTLTATLQTQVASLQASTQALQAALGAEQAARIAADSALNQAIGQLQSAQMSFANQLAAQQSALSTLSSQLAAETAARNAQYQQLNTAVQQLTTTVQAGEVKFYEATPVATFLPNGVLTTLAKLDNLPSGLFLVSGQVTVTNFDNDAFWDCGLYYNDQFLMHRLETRTIGVGVVNIDSPVSSLTVETLASGQGSISLKCKSGQPKSGVENIKLFALQFSAN